MVWVKRTAFLLLALAVIALTAAYLVLRASLPNVSGIFETTGGVAHTTALSRDNLGTAVIKAESANDAAYALGFAHGQDRYFQLDLQRRYAAGELSALFGERALPHDKLYRIHQLRKRANSAVANMDPTSRELLQRYVAGVNAGLGSLTAFPFEYQLLGQDPSPWTTTDSLLVSGFMFSRMTSSTTRRDYARQLLFQSGGNTLLSFLQPEGTIWDTALDGSKIATPQIPSASEWALSGTNMQAQVLAQPLPPMKGSNSWAVAGNLTDHGGALLANDPHLGFSLPHIWYRTQLSYNAANGASVQLTGVSLPGLPAVAIGTNGKVAWGLTNSAGDWADLIALEITDQTYQSPQGLEQLQMHSEVIEVAGAEDVEIEVSTTKWGPVHEINGRAYAWRWLAHDPYSLDPTNFQALDTATSSQEVLEIGKRTGLSPFNLLVADNKGNGGWTIVGRMPKRGPASTDRVIPWQLADQTWQGWLAPEDYPQITSAQQDRLWTANNRIVGGANLHKIGTGQYELGTRGWLIEQDMKAADQFDEKLMLEMMYNDKAATLESWQLFLVKLLSKQPDLDALEEQALTLLKGWSGRANVNDAGYTVVRRFRDRFSQELNAVILSKLQQDGILPNTTDVTNIWLFSRQSEGAFLHLRDEQPAHWLPADQTSWDMWSLSMLKNVLQELDSRYGSLPAARWGRENTLVMHHPIAGSLPDFLAAWLNMPADELAGDSNMPLAQHPRAGQSMRFVVAPGREKDGFLIVPAGQSGHPLSKWYASGHDDWVNYRTTPLLPGPIEATLTLEP